ncbi:MAG: NADH-quinone oxidoreductase subunit J family protein [Actinomycetota bacterium]
MTARTVVFACCGLATVGAAGLAVLSRQVVHAAMWLVVALGALAGCYLLLGAEVIALVQVLIYVGAIVVLVLFALMLTRAPIGATSDVDHPAAARARAAIAGVLTTGVLAVVLFPAVSGRTITVDDARGAAEPLATSLFDAWVWPFELLSLVLLVALVTALVLSRDDERSPRPGSSRERQSTSAHGDR